jgi:hypothetical protein
MTNAQLQQILNETVREFGRKEWFRDAGAYEKHPDSGEPVLEFKVNYIPILERKEVKTFALRFGMTERFLIVDRNGNPSQ